VIILSDQDDIWDKKKIEITLKAFADHPDAGYVFSDAKLVDETLSPIGSLWERVNFIGPRYDGYVNGNQVEAMLGGGNFVYGNSLAFRACFRDIVLPIDSVSKSITHDTWIGLLLSAVGAKGVAMPKALLSYRQHPQQVVGAGSEKSLREKVISAKQKKIIDYLEKSKDVGTLRDRAVTVSVKSVGILNDYIAHLEVRAALPSMAPLPRVRAIIYEYKSGRYSRFSSSLKSVFRDILFA
jgi:hypothetical protein